MRRIAAALALFVAAFASAPVTEAQDSPQRDPQALLLISQSVAAMGGVAPSSSVATGTVDLVEGSTEDRGRVRILSRGLEESREEMHLSRGLRARLYAKRRAAGVSDTGRKEVSLEMAASSQSPNFPLILLANAANDPDFAFEYLGVEDLGGATAHHIRFWNTYASEPHFQPLTEFTVKDLWIDAASGLPRKLSYDEREAAGAVPRIRIEAHYSDYRNVGGVLYPFLIERVFNGTPWATIRIENVALDVGLSDADFQVE